MLRIKLIFTLNVSQNIDKYRQQNIPEKFLEELLLAETDLDVILLDVDVLVMLLEEVDLDVILLDVAVLEKLLLFADADLIEELLLVEADLAEMVLADKDLVLAMDGREFT